MTGLLSGRGEGMLLAPLNLLYYQHDHQLRCRLKIIKLFQKATSSIKSRHWSVLQVIYRYRCQPYWWQTHFSSNVIWKIGRWLTFHQSCWMYQQNFGCFLTNYGTYPNDTNHRQNLRAMCSCYYSQTLSTFSSYTSSITCKIRSLLVCASFSANLQPRSSNSVLPSNESPSILPRSQSSRPYIPSTTVSNSAVWSFFTNVNCALLHVGFDHSIENQFMLTYYIISS